MMGSASKCEEADEYDDGEDDDGAASPHITVPERGVAVEDAESDIIVVVVVVVMEVESSAALLQSLCKVHSLS